MKIAAGVALAVALAGGIAYYALVPRGPIISFVPERDTKEILKIFYDDWYWLFPGPNYDPEFILARQSPGKDYHPRYHGKLNIRVIRQDGKLAGFTTYYKKNFYEGRVQFVAVSPDFRRRGYGRMLTVYGVKKLFADGCKKIGLVTRHNNPARRIYERLGFKYGGYLPGEKEEDGLVGYSLEEKDFKPKS
ncbi:GNAT family N-acetyltransferase [Candidatus Dependentiae bacterium]